MSLSYTLANATSGLKAVAAQTEVISANIANAQNTAYTKRAVVLSAQDYGGKSGGVAVTALARLGNAMATSERRSADTLLEGQSALLEGLERLEVLVGGSGGGATLSSKITALQGALVLAQADPASETLLANTSAALSALVGTFNDTSQALQEHRAEADATLARAVTTLNTNLERIKQLNTQIVRATAQGEDAAAYQDQRQALIDEIAVILPVQELPRSDGSVVLMGAGGLLLLDTRPAEFSFAQAGTMAAEMTLAGGALALPMANGQSLSLTSLGNGTLSAALALRDSYLPAAQTALDQIASSVAAALTIGGESLLTRAGQPISGAITGLAAELSVDARLQGAAWRLRDGLSASAQGPTGNSTLLKAFASGLEGSGGSTAVVEQANKLLVQVSANRVAFEASVSSSRAYRDALYLRESAKSVDSDAELQALMQMEKAYAANARLISAVDEMLRQLLEAV